MNGLETSLYSAAVALCVFSAGLVRSRADRVKSGTFYFTAFLAIEAAAFVCELLMAHPAMPAKSLWLGLRMALSLFIGPCIWLVVRESVEPERPSLRSLSSGHWLAIGLGVLCVAPLWSATHAGTEYANPLRPSSWLYSRTIHTTMLACIGIFAVQVPWYVARSRRMLLSSAAEPRWLQWPLVAVSVTWLLGLLRTAQCALHAPRELTVLFAAVETSVTVIALYLVVRQRTVPPRVAETPTSEPAPKYVRSTLDARTVARIRGKVEDALNRADICGDSLLSLRSLSQRIGEKAHYVSQVLNQELGTTFYELISRRRIERAKPLLRDFPERTVLEIALEVGFNSKSTFNTAFRRETGMTPTAFREQPAG